MSIGPGNVAAGAAGVPLAQTKGSEVERAGQDAAAAQTKTASNEKAELASGIGRADGEEQADNDRDADGRRLWEQAPRGNEKDTEPETSEEESSPRSKDASGQCGNELDLSG